VPIGCPPDSLPLWTAKNTLRIDGCHAGLPKGHKALDSFRESLFDIEPVECVRTPELSKKVHDRLLHVRSLLEHVVERVEQGKKCVESPRPIWQVSGLKHEAVELERLLFGTFEIDNKRSTLADLRLVSIYSVEKSLIGLEIDKSGEFLYGAEYIPFLKKSLITLQRELKGITAVKQLSSKANIVLTEGGWYSVGIMAKAYSVDPGRLRSRLNHAYQRKRLAPGSRKKEGGNYHYRLSPQLLEIISKQKQAEEEDRAKK